MNAVQPDESVFDKLPGVRKGEYFYALGSLAKHKNYKWVREVAARNPDKTFVVAGGRRSGGLRQGRGGTPPATPATSSTPATSPTGRTRR